VVEGFVDVQLPAIEGDDEESFVRIDLASSRRDSQHN
jgi:hypothetical protein